MPTTPELQEDVAVAAMTFGVGGVVKYGGRTGLKLGKRLMGDLRAAWNAGKRMVGKVSKMFNKNHELALSPYRYTQAGETFIRYESGNPIFSKITSGGVKPGTFAAPIGDGLVPLGQRPSTYNLPSPKIPRPNVIILKPPPGTLIIGPRPVAGGTGNEVLFPMGY